MWDRGEEEAEESETVQWSKLQKDEVPAKLQQLMQNIWILDAQKTRSWDPGTCRFWACFQHITSFNGALVVSHGHLLARAHSTTVCLSSVLGLSALLNT